MANDAGPGKNLTKKRIKEVDGKYPSPKERAEEVEAAIQLAEEELSEELTFYDRTCFAVQWIGLLANGPLADDSDLHVLAVALNRWLHERHYHHAEEIFDAP